PPDDRALARRQGFEEIADFGGRERVDQPPYRAQPTAVERVRKQTQLARGLVVADGFGHAGVPASWEAWSRRIHEGRDRVRRSCGHYRRTRRRCTPSMRACRGLGLTSRAIAWRPME